MSTIQMIFLCWGLTSEPENICPPLPIEQFWDHGQGYDLQISGGRRGGTQFLADFSHGSSGNPVLNSRTGTGDC